MPFVNFIPNIALGTPIGDVRAVPAATPTAPNVEPPQDIKPEDQFGTLKSLNALADESLWFMKAYNDVTKDKENYVDPEYAGAYDEIQGTKYAPYWETFARSNNAAYTRALMMQIDNEEERQKLVAASGWAGTATMLGMQLLDPLNYIPVANAAIKVKGGYRLAATMLEAGASQGAIVAAQEALMQQHSVTRTPEESFINIGIGAVMGSVLGAGAHALLSASERAAVEKGLDGLISTGGRQSVGAAAVDTLTRDQLSIDGVIARTIGENTAINPVLRSMKRASASARQYTNQIYENTLYMLGHRQNVTTGAAAETAIGSQITARLTNALKTTDQIFSNMKKAGIRMSAKEFEDAVGQAMRMGDEGPNEFVTQAARAWREQQFDPLLKRAIDAGMLEEGVTTKTALSYFSRMYDYKMLVAREGEFKARLLPHINRQIQENFAEDRQKLTARIANLEQRIADLNLSPEERAQTLIDLKKQGDAFELSNPEHFERLSDINADRQAAKAAKDAGDSVKADQLLERARQKAKDGGEDYANFVKARAALRARMRNVDQGVAGMQARQMKISQQIAAIEEKAIKSQRALLARGQAFQKQLANINDEQIAEKLTSLKDGFEKLTQDSEKALQRHRDEIAKLQEQIAQTKADAKDAKSGAAVKTAQEAEEAVVEIEDRIADLTEERKAATKAKDKFQAAQIDERISALKEDMKKAKGFRAADAKRAEEVNPMTLPALRQEIEDANKKMIAKIEKAAQKEAERKARLERISDRIRVAEQLDPDAMRQAIFDGMDQLAMESAGRGLDRGEAAAKLAERFQRMDPEKVKAYREELLRQRQSHEANFYDRWGRRMGGDLDGAPATPPPKQGYTRYYYGSADADAKPSSWDELWVTPNRDYAANYRAMDGKENTLFYVDIPNDQRVALGVWNDINNFGINGKLPKEWAQKAAKLEEGSGVDFTDAARATVDEVYDKLTGRHNTEGDSPSAEYSVPITRGPLKERTFNVPDALLVGDRAKGETNFLVDNVREVGERYITMMTREIELKERGLIGKEWDNKVLQVKSEYADMRAQVNEAATYEEALKVVGRDPGMLDNYNAWRRGVSKEEAGKERLLEFLTVDEDGALEDMRVGRDLLRGTFMAKENASNFARISRTAMLFNYIRLSGGFALANFQEIYKPAMVHGLTSYFRDAVGPLVRGLEGARGSVREGQLAGLIGERTTQHRALSIAEMGDKYARGTTFERFMLNLGKIASKWNGLAYFTDVTQSIASMVSQHRILEDVLATGGDTRFLRYLGISEEMQGRIASEFKQHGRLVDGVKVANTEKWGDQAAVSAYRYAIYKDVNSIIPKRGVGDIPISFNHPLGKMIMQFRAFNLAAHQRVMLRGLQEDKTRFMLGVVSMTAVGAMVSAIRAWRQGEEGWQRWHTAAANPGFVIGEGLDMSGIFPLAFEMSNTIEKMSQATGRSPFNPIKTPMMALFPGESQMGSSSRYASRDPINALLGPTAGLVSGSLQALGMPLGALAGDDATKRQEKAFIGMLPFNTHLGMKETLQLFMGDSPYTQ